jgi:hypothetical protein
MKKEVYEKIRKLEEKLSGKKEVQDTDQDYS